MNGNIEKHDIVIPLGIKSYCNMNFEIKVAIASIRKFCKFTNRIIIVSQIDPIKSLGDDIIWIYQDDIYGHDKDANIIEKTRAAIEKIPDLTDDFILWSDDQFITKDTYWEDTVPRYVRIYNNNTKLWFNVMARKRIWFARLLQVYERFPNHGFGLKFWEPHIPTRINKHKFIEMCNTFDYKHEHGITIFTLYNSFIGEEGVKEFDHFHCKNGELNWNDCRWIGFFDKSLRSSDFVNKLKSLFNV